MSPILYKRALLSIGLLLLDMGEGALFIYSLSLCGCRLLYLYVDLIENDQTSLFESSK